MIKSDFELDIIRAAGKMNTEVFSALRDIIKPGMTEVEVAGEIEYLYRKKSHLGPTRMRSFNHELFFGHVLSGASAFAKTSFNSPLGGNGVHAAYGYGPSQKIISKNESILIDYVSNYNGYHVDTTRTCVIGKISAALEKHYEKLQAVYSLIQSKIAPGVSCMDIYSDVMDFILSEKLEKNFMGYDSEHVAFIGHGIGIEIDEYPVIAPRFDMKIEKNMVLAFEPKMFFPDEGVIGLEDTLIVTETGTEPVTHLDNGIIRI
jgi:Xaa-Pro aminopeptidase